MSLVDHLKRSLWLRYSPRLRFNWPKPKFENGKRPLRVAVVVVNYNTVRHISHLLFSLCRVVGREKFSEVVVVDNNSKDGSLAVLRTLKEAGLITLIANTRQQYHGPGLNQAMRYLAAKARRDEKSRPDYILILDSDVVVLRSTIIEDMLPEVLKIRAGLVGEIEAYEYIKGGLAHISSILIDPQQVWRRGIMPFEEHGVPDLEFQRSLVRRGIHRHYFPLRSDFYLLHLWGGTLRQVRDAGLKDNKYYEWASTSVTKSGVEDFPQNHYMLEEFYQVFQAEVPELTPAAMVKACQSKNQIALLRPLELLASKK